VGGIGVQQSWEQILVGFTAIGRRDKCTGFGEGFTPVGGATISAAPERRTMVRSFRGAVLLLEAGESGFAECASPAPTGNS
jgi:hypothetical protein